MSALLRFPEFRTKAFTLSYDDGTVHDVKLVNIMREYGVKGTFNLCGERIKNSDGSYVLDEKTAVELFSGEDIEVAVHGAKHLSLSFMEPSVATRDILFDREILEKMFKKIIKGMAYACGKYNDSVVEMLRHCGIEYARTTVSTNGFDVPTDWLRMPATTHHRNPDLMALCDKFLAPFERDYFWSHTPKLFYVWGHSFEFNNNNNWDIMNRLLDKVAGREDVWYATNMEIYRYVKAFKSLNFSTDLEYVENPTATDVYLDVMGKNIMVGAGKTVEIK